jgi:hypothetical protein
MATSPQPCRFYAKGKCTNTVCPYAHKDCRYGASCTNPKCGYRHPNAADRQQPQQPQQSHAPCRYGARCNKQGCRFAHTQEATVPKQTLSPIPTEFEEDDFDEELDDIELICSEDENTDPDEDEAFAALIESQMQGLNPNARVFVPPPRV